MRSKYADWPEEKKERHRARQRKCWANRSEAQRSKDKIEAKRRTKEHQERFPEKVNLWAKNKRSHPSTWPQIVLRNIRYRAKQLGVPFDLAAEDIVVPMYCPITCRPLDFDGGDNNQLGPSVDRVRPSLGYVKGNIRVISRMANRIKQDCTDPVVFRRVAEYIEGKL